MTTMNYIGLDVHKIGCILAALNSVENRIHKALTAFDDHLYSLLNQVRALTSYQHIQDSNREARARDRRADAEE